MFITKIDICNYMIVWQFIQDNWGYGFLFLSLIFFFRGKSNPNAV